MVGQMNVEMKKWSKRKTHISMETFKFSILEQNCWKGRGITSWEFEKGGERCVQEKERRRERRNWGNKMRNRKKKREEWIFGCEFDVINKLIQGNILQYRLLMNINVVKK